MPLTRFFCRLALADLAFIVVALLIGSNAHAQGALRDPPICTSREKDFVGAPPVMPPQCAAPLIHGKHPELHVKLEAAQRPVAIPRYGANGASQENFRVLDAYSYFPDPDHAGDGTLLPPVLRPNIGDTLKIRLENNLPDARDPHSNAMGPQVTNLHTHGMVVSPRDNGDNVFVLVTPKNASAPVSPMADVTMAQGAFDYAIKIPVGKIAMPGGNPSQSRAGLFWFHPHPHGLSQAQIARGLSGLIAVGAVGDYADCVDGAGVTISCDAIRRHFLMLRDFTLKKSGDDWAIADRQAGVGRYCDSALNGDCAGDPTKKWLFTLNGAVKPVLRMQAGETRLIRLGNMSADVTYKLQVVATDGAQNLPKIQLIAKDGIAVAQSQPFPMLLMPAARAEFMISIPASGGRWVLRTLGHDTGGDSWPAADLLEIDAPPVSPVAEAQPPATLAAAPPTSAASAPNKQAGNGIVLQKARAAQIPAMVSKYPLKPLAPQPESALSAPNPALDAALQRPAPTKTQSHDMAGHGRSHESKSAIDPCLYERLKPGQRRIVTLKQDPVDPVFMIGYGVAGPGAVYTEIAPPRQVDMSRIDVCVKHGGEEIWEIVNTTPEIHNFHIHQVKFMVSAVRWKASAADCAYVNLSPGAGNHCDTTGVAGAGGHDTFPVPPNGGRLTLAIAFRNTSQIGKFVFHCHLLEHEDHGMMAILTVKP